jgi:D-alanyl-D-alanine carboxypeptidase
VFTATMILKLIEAGKLSLNTTLGELNLGALVDGLDPKITVQQLLNHTSGLANYWDDDAFDSAFSEHPELRWEPHELIAYAKRMDRVGAPGGAFHYADTNYVLLGLIIEHIEQASLEEVFRRDLFEPLAMKDTFFSHGEHVADVEQAHRFEGKDDLFGLEHQSADWAGGGLVSTTRDLEKLFRSLGGDQFWTARTPTRDQDVSYGLGVFGVELDGGRGSLWGHDGHGNAFAYYWPEKDILFTGTLNQTKADWWPIVEEAIALLS